VPEKAAPLHLDDIRGDHTTPCAIRSAAGTRRTVFFPQAMANFGQVAEIDAELDGPFGLHSSSAGTIFSA
jgi:hypothetical protein